MRRKLFALVLILTAAFVLYAQGETVKLSGYLIDNACSAGHAKDAGFADRVKKHKKSCALMPSCEGSGFAVYADGKLYKLDDAGNKSAAELLKSTDTAMGVMVAIEGTVDGETVHVTKLTEVKTAAE